MSNSNAAPSEGNLKSEIHNPKSPDPFTLVIFGASGDLTRRKLMPAVYSLFREGLLPNGFQVVGAARSRYDDEGFRSHLDSGRPGSADQGSADQGSADQRSGDETWAAFRRKVHYQPLVYDDPAGYGALCERLNGDGAPRNALFYLAIPPERIAPVADRLRDCGLARKGDESPWSRIIVEKPFGRDLDTARALNQRIRTSFAEDQIFRIDHYLGKETVQNLLVLRFANSIFEPIWNQKYVDHVQITVSETLGVEGRGGYYETAGALRDIVQNHMMHLLCLVAMEPPLSLAPDAVRDEKVKVLRALRPIPRECIINGTVRAQYGPGTVGGEPVPGYLEEDGVAADSRTDTFVAFRAFIDNWRSSGVPFYMRTGKRMPARMTELSVHFRDVPQVLFNTGTFGPMPPNILAIRIQPNEGISMRFQVKVPGPAMRLEPFQMNFGYLSAFGKGPPDAYERLILDAALGDATLFTRGDEIEAAWAFVAPVIEGCERQDTRPLPQYAAGSWGPKEADGLIEGDGRRWYLTRRPKEKTP